MGYGDGIDNLAGVQVVYDPRIWGKLPIISGRARGILY
jgi:hypothetical protein